MTNVQTVGPRMTGLATAVPGNPIAQHELAARIAELSHLEEREATKLSLFFRKTGIGHRYSVLSDFNNGTAELFGNAEAATMSRRMAAYDTHALPLSLQAVKNLTRQLQSHGEGLGQITHLITVSCTGMSAPGLEIALLKALHLPLDLPRYTVNFMGCYAAVQGLRLAKLIALEQPQARVLMVCIELCSLHFQFDSSEDYLLAHALFADGAAALLVEGGESKTAGLSLNQFYSALEPADNAHMAWRLGETGFLMQLSSYVPQLLAEPMRRLLNRIDFFSGQRPQHFAIHPGGTRILKSFEEAANLTPADLWASYEVFHQRGNMSSPTVLFVLEKLWPHLQQTGGEVFMAAYGPGLTIEAARLHYYN